MEIFTLLETLEDLLERSRNLPFSSKSVVDKDEMLDLIKEIRIKLPDELKQAKWVKEERQRILVEAQKEADGIVKEAENRIIAMIDEHEITRKAYDQKTEIIETANEMSREISKGTKEYADSILGNTESVLHETLSKLETNMNEALKLMEISLEDTIIAFSHPLPSEHLLAEVGDIQIPISLVMEDTPRTLNSNFMLMEYWKKSLVYNGLWLYRFGGSSNKRTLRRGEIPAWIMDSYSSNILEPFIGNRYLWIRIKSDREILLPMDTAILLNSIPLVNYDIQNVKLSYSEPIQRLENDKTGTFFLGEVQDPELVHEYFIRDFDVSQYDNERIREDITNLYRHYVNDYFAFVDSNSLHDGSTLRALRQSMMQVYDSLEEYRTSNARPYGGTYAIRNPRNNQQPIVLTYFTTNGERGNLLRRGAKLSSYNAAIGQVETLIDANGGRNKIKDFAVRKEFAKHIVNSNDRIFTKIDLLQYCKVEFMRAFGEESLHFCSISLSEDNIVVNGLIEKCIEIHFNIISDALKEVVYSSDFFSYLKINIELRKSFSSEFNIL